MPHYTTLLATLHYTTCHTTPHYLPHYYTSHPECHDLMHAMNWTDGLPITTSVVKILKNVTQESVDLKS